MAYLGQPGCMIPPTWPTQGSLDATKKAYLGQPCEGGHALLQVQEEGVLRAHQRAVRGAMGGDA